MFGVYMIVFFWEAETGIRCSGGFLRFYFGCPFFFFCCVLGFFFFFFLGGGKWVLFFWGFFFIFFLGPLFFFFFSSSSSLRGEGGWASMRYLGVSN